ncbi:DUF302 domain-containing protein [Aequorivita viscosa]|uniref:Uncharacterized conserved protein, DUF302 family n=1 Tax=Aequorivita viscosa TaxID=797419 RepID=A0A1M6NXE3_9FLAO|nr:DUF302 domain-containing protein [Aequorivita viscosa]SDX49506.1 Uncharacterized conserved protein, DUF302 family [Aequorivita viscosa]SHK00346.1 Uncharacterized conserved protein, DUF302 family [Aequorivita viscosa]
MSYYISTTLKNTDFSDAIEKTVAALKEEGFGVLTEIDIKATLKKKLDADFYNYTILGACNPGMAYEALQAENKIGTMLPCNVIVQERESGIVEISAVDPAASMMAVQNDSLAGIAIDVREKLTKVIQNI